VDVLNLLSLIVAVISLVFLGYLTFVMLQFTARPKLRVTLQTRPSSQRRTFAPSQQLTLRFLLENTGYWFAHPAARNANVYVNFSPEFQPTTIRYGSTLERLNRNLRIGKEHSKYLKADAIHLFHGEPGEPVEVDVTMPELPGRYRCWVTVYTDQGGCGVHRFGMAVVGVKLP